VLSKNRRATPKEVEMSQDSTTLPVALESVDLRPEILGKAAKLGQLSGQQRALLTSLENLGSIGPGIKLSVMYLGSLVTLGDIAHPDRFALAAHGVRELMEKLPASLEVPQVAHRENLGDKAQGLRGEWRKLLRNTSCRPASDWEGPIDTPVRTFLGKVEIFFGWLESNNPRRRQETQAALTRLDGSRRPLPPALASRNVDDWHKLREFFQSISHHNRPTDDEEFSARLDALERFLLERMRPKTFDDIAVLDALMRGSDADTK
jgi:hypothetical protein